MKKLMIALGAVALATPALAQMTTPAVPPTPSAPVTAGTTMAPPTAVAPASPAAIIATEFPTYDKDSNGTLNAAEFDGWMIALKDKSGAPAMKPAERKAWLDGAFATADKDKNKSVSQAELTTYLTAGA
ncbi:EF-hand domain-containing protein [Sphingomonas sp.]|uniref:EF-hand domain-containing protein n=1 Tax=Sphingomonas sp. TaxID=28214 RepID=UPI0025CBFA47|nr:EF-hand domain-containing protein [Sphingomonas sp.]